MSGMVPVLNKQNTISTQPMRYKMALCAVCNTLHAELDADGCLSVWCDCTLDKSTNGDVPRACGQTDG